MSVCPFAKCVEHEEPDIENIQDIGFDPQNTKLIYQVKCYGENPTWVWRDNILRASNLVMIEEYNEYYKAEYSKNVKILKKALSQMLSYEEELPLTADHAYFDGNERCYLASKIENMVWDDGKVKFMIHWKGGAVEPGGLENVNLGHYAIEDYKKNHREVYNKVMKKYRSHEKMKKTALAAEKPAKTQKNKKNSQAAARKDEDKAYRPKETDSDDTDSSEGETSEDDGSSEESRPTSPVAGAADGSKKRKRVSGTSKPSSSSAKKNKDHASKRDRSSSSKNAQATPSSGEIEAGPSDATSRQNRGSRKRDRPDSPSASGELQEVKIEINNSLDEVVEEAKPSGMLLDATIKEEDRNMPGSGPSGQHLVPDILEPDRTLRQVEVPRDRNHNKKTLPGNEARLKRCRDGMKEPKIPRNGELQVRNRDQAFLEMPQTSMEEEVEKDTVVAEVPKQPFSIDLTIATMERPPPRTAGSMTTSPIPAAIICPRHSSSEQENPVRKSVWGCSRSVLVPSGGLDHLFNCELCTANAFFHSRSAFRNEELTDTTKEAFLKVENDQKYAVVRKLLQFILNKGMWIGPVHLVPQLEVLLNWIGSLKRRLAQVDNEMPLVYLAVSTGDLSLVRKVLEVSTDSVFKVHGYYNLLEHAVSATANMTIVHFLLRRGVISRRNWNRDFQNPLDASKALMNTVIRQKLMEDEWMKHNAIINGPLVTLGKGQEHRCSFTWNDGSTDECMVAIVPMKWSYKDRRFEFLEIAYSIWGIQFNGKMLVEKVPIFIQKGVVLRFAVDSRLGKNEIMLDTTRHYDNSVFFGVQCFKRKWQPAHSSSI